MSPTEKIHSQASFFLDPPPDLLLSLENINTLLDQSCVLCDLVKLKKEQLLHNHLFIHSYSLPLGELFGLLGDWPGYSVHQKCQQLLYTSLKQSNKM